MTSLDELEEVALESFKRGARHFVEFRDDGLEIGRAHV